MHTMLTFCLERLDTPTGRLLIVTDEDDHRRVRAVDWEDHEHRLQRLLRIHYGSGTDAFRLREAPSRSPASPSSASPSPASRALEAYFDGNLRALIGLQTATNGTAFQRTVWDALCHIPVGQTITYRALAQDIGRPTATRAVGLANGSNPISIVVPCHRVIGTNKSLTGYGGGLERKRWLLTHEGIGIPL
jgi:methylated-DNA-[protein]-cysteine S-methyltransferase